MDGRDLGMRVHVREECGDRVFDDFRVVVQQQHEFPCAERQAKVGAARVAEVLFGTDVDRARVCRDDLLGAGAFTRPVVHHDDLRGPAAFFAYRSEASGKQIVALKGDDKN